MLHPVSCSCHKEQKCKPSSWMLKQTCASPNLTRPSLLRIHGRIAPDHEYKLRFRNVVVPVYVRLWNIILINRRRSPRQFHHIINLPQNWRGHMIPNCEIQNTVVVISCPLQVVVDEDAAGNKIFCTRAPGFDIPDWEASSDTKSRCLQRAYMNDIEFFYLCMLDLE